MANQEVRDDGEPPETTPQWHTLECVDPGYYATTRTRSLLIFLLLSLQTFAQSLMATCIFVILPVIAHDTDATVEQSLGFGVVYLLTSTLAQPVFKELSFVFGRRVPFTLGAALFVLGTALCGWAETATLLLVARGIQGIGAGGPIPIEALILTDLFDMRQRAKWVSFLNIAWTIGTVSGPLIGGLLVRPESIGWRWIFWVTVPIISLCLIGGLLMLGYDRDRRRGISYAFLLKKVDYIGLLSFICGTPMIVGPLNLTGSIFPWNKWCIYVVLASGLACFICLGIHVSSTTRQRRLCGGACLVPPKKPLFRPSLFTCKESVASFVCTTIHSMVMWIILHYLSIYILGIKGVSSLMAGLWSLPGTLSVAPAAILVGIFVRRTGEYRGFLIAGWIMTCCTFIALLGVKQGSPPAFIMIINLSAGLSLGVLVPALSTAVQASVSRAESGQATCMNLQLRPAGQCLGTALGLAAFSHGLFAGAKSMKLGPELAENIMKNMGTKMQSGSKPVDSITAGIIMSALKNVWIMGLSFSIFALVLMATCGPKNSLPADRLVGWDTINESRDNTSEITGETAVRERAEGVAGSVRGEPTQSVELQTLPPPAYQTEWSRGHSGDESSNYDEARETRESWDSIESWAPDEAPQGSQTATASKKTV